MNKAKKITKIVLYSLLSLIAIYCFLIIIQKIIWKDRIPSILGFQNYIVLSGSMEPTLNIGDIVFIKKTDEINEEDIISFKVNNSIVTHRVISIIKNEDNKIQYITKGDNNNGADDESIFKEDILGKYVFKIGKLGNIILFLKTKSGMVILILMFLLLILFTNTNEKPKKKKK